MKKILCFSLITVFFVMLSAKSFSQVSAVKLNVPALLGGVINPEIETAVSPSVSLNLALWAYPWARMPIVKNHLLGFAAQPGMRYWFQGLHTGVFIGAHATGAYGELAYKGTEYRGIALGLGISAGYAWMLAPRWNLELELGASAFYIRYDARRVGGAYTGRLQSKKILPLPSKAGLNLVYLF